MSEAFWAQIISGFFGLASMGLGIYLPYRLRRNEERGKVGGSSGGGGGSGPPAAPQSEVAG